MLIGVLLLVVMPETGFKPTQPEDRNTWQNMAHTFRNGIQMVKRRPILISILGIGLFYGLYSEGYDRLWTKHLIDDISLPAWGGLSTVTWFGIINMAGIFLSIFATEIVRRRTDTRDQRAIATTMMLVTFGLVASLIAFAQTRIFLLALLLIWSIVIIRNVIGPLYTTWVNQRLDSSVRATVISMSSQVDAVGQIGGGPIIGMIGNLFSVPAAITFSGLLLSPILGLYARALRRTNGHLAVETPPGD